MSDLLLARSKTGDEKLYVDDVFSTYLYTGNGSTQTINNGIDLAGEGGLVWLKSRSGSGAHLICDTERPDATGTLRPTLKTNTTDAQTNINSVGDFLSNGFTIGNDSNANASGQTYASWTFRKAPEFFDIVTYTGNGVAGRQIPHGLGVAPGMITSKSTSTTGNWNVYHRSAAGDLVLNSTAAQTGSRAIITAADSSTFTVSGAANTNGVQYVAYLWAHDPGEDGIVQCGSYVGNSNGASAPVPVNLGWEPQFVLIKNASSGSVDWVMFDAMRGLTAGPSSIDPVLYPNSNTNENPSFSWIEPTATGFNINSNSLQVCGAGNTHIYLAIRRPNKPPKTGTEVYKPYAYTGSNGGAAANFTTTGWPVDLVINRWRNTANTSVIQDRLRGSQYELATDSASAEISYGLPIGFANSTGITGLRDNATNTGVAELFRRAPGFFDVVCYTGTGVARTVPHGLGVAPELIILKIRTGSTGNWAVYHTATGASQLIQLNTTGAAAVNSSFNDTAPTSVVFSVGTSGNVNGSTFSYVAYLFASLPGISKVGSYTGNGTSQTIPCGFTTGARFILIKRTDAAGDWYVWDSARGIVAANDPHLSLNTTAAEVTNDDSVDPDATGFIVNQNTATNINVSGASYIFLSVA